MRPGCRPLHDAVTNVVLADQVSTLEAQIAATTRAKRVLEHHLTCKQERPMQCPWLLKQLDVDVQAALDFKFT